MRGFKRGGGPFPPSEKASKRALEKAARELLELERRELAAQEALTRAAKLESELEQKIAEARALGLEDAAYLTANTADAEVFRAQAARVRRRES